MDRLPIGEPERWPDPRVRYALLAAAVLIVGLAGFVGFLVYPRIQASASIGAGTLVLASAAGVAVFFSPCAFPMLLTLLVREAETAGPNARSSALRFALAFSAGVALVLLALGLLISAGGRGLASSVTFTSASGITVRWIVGVLLVILGLVQLETIPVSFHGVERYTKPVSRWQADLRRRRPRAGHFAFGSVYLLIGSG